MGFQRTQRLGDRLADRHARIEARERILEDDLEILAQLAHLGGGESAQVAAEPEHRAVGLGDQLEDRARQRRLAAAGFADDAERLAPGAR